MHKFAPPRWGGSESCEPARQVNKVWRQTPNRWFILEFRTDESNCLPRVTIEAQALLYLNIIQFYRSLLTKYPTILFSHPFLFFFLSHLELVITLRHLQQSLGKQLHAWPKPVGNVLGCYSCEALPTICRPPLPSTSGSLAPGWQESAKSLCSHLQLCGTSSARLYPTLAYELQWGWRMLHDAYSDWKYTNITFQHFHFRVDRRMLFWSLPSILTKIIWFKVGKKPWEISCIHGENMQTPVQTHNLAAQQ